MWKLSHVSGTQIQIPGGAPEPACWTDVSRWFWYTWYPTYPRVWMPFGGIPVAHLLQLVSTLTNLLTPSCTSVSTPVISFLVPYKPQQWHWLWSRGSNSICPLVEVVRAHPVQPSKQEPLKTCGDFVSLFNVVSSFSQIESANCSCQWLGHKYFWLCGSHDFCHSYSALPESGHAQHVIEWM